MQGHPPEWAQYALPDAKGHFGPYGGVFVAETLRAARERQRAIEEERRRVLSIP